VARAERAAARRDGEVRAAGVGAEPGLEGERAAERGAAERDRHAAAVELDLGERVELEAAEVGGDRGDPRQRHAVDQHGGVAGRGAADRDRREAAEPAERTHVGAGARGHDVGQGRVLAGVLVDVDPRHERRLGEGGAPVAVGLLRGGQVVEALARPIAVHDDHLVGARPRGRAQNNGRNDEDQAAHKSPHVTRRRSLGPVS
jgi:hypothetical protein